MTVLQKLKLNPVNSLQEKSDKLREIEKISNPTFIGIRETKIHNSISDSETSIDKQSAIENDQNRKGRGVICYVTKKIYKITESCISNEVENIFNKLLKIKPISIGSIYKAIDQTKFLEILSDSLNSLSMLIEE